MNKTLPGILALVALLAGIIGCAGCAAPSSPDEKELRQLERELQDVKSEIAGLKRVSSASGEAPSAEIGGLEEKRDDIERRIAELRQRIADESSE